MRKDPDATIVERKEKRQERKDQIKKERKKETGEVGSNEREFIDLDDTR